MQAGNFAQFERVHNQRDVAVRCEPYAMTLAIGSGLGAFAPFPVVMAALIQNCRVALWRGPGKIEIGRDVQSGETLEMKLLDREVRSLEPPRDRRFERSSLGHRFQPQHVEEIFAQR